MRLLVLGGTAWLGRAVAAAAVALDHEVVCLARGRSGAPAAGARLIPADRDHPDALRVVAGHTWDAVVDVSRQPGQVRRAARALSTAAGHYVLVSTANVYADTATPDTDETAALLDPLDADLLTHPEDYGQAKVACELAVREAFGERSLVARAGLIGGPGDATARSGYWPWRFAHPAATDGAVLVPAEQARSSQVIDVRDLASWLVRATEQRVGGAFNACGDATPLADHLSTARQVAGHQGPLVPATDEWLIAHDVAQWMGPRSLPLWLADAEWAGFTSHRNDAAKAAGLRLRPLARTLADALDWERRRPEDLPRQAGLSDDDERSLLTLLRHPG